MFKFAVLLGFLAVAAIGSSVRAADEDPYAKPENWLCRPGAADPCATPTAVTVVAADGARSLKTLAPRTDAQVDCFYVYPTISEEPTGNSDLIPGPGEKRAVALQFAPFASVCRPFAPMYRQITLAGLSSFIAGKPLPMDPELGYRDVLAAWKHYLANDNNGRGVVLIGHSQGSRVLARLMKEEIDGKPAQALLAGVLLIGFNVEVPDGADVGGTFKSIKLCRAPGELGCVIAYESFRASSPPPSGARFAYANKPDMEVACTDPTALTGAPLEAMLPVHTDLLGQPTSDPAWAEFAKTIDTPLASLPGLLKASCARNSSASYLAIELNSDGAGKRPSDIPGDLIIRGHRLADWGLHLIDVNLAMGNLLAWVGSVHKP